MQHVIQLPIFQSLRVYHAHSASVTGISISPYPPPLPSFKAETAARAAAQSANSPARPASGKAESVASSAAVSRKPRDAAVVPNTPSNNIYIATSSTDGNVCVQSLVDMRDVSLRNFARPVQAVALSPEYKTDRTYLSGGLAGQLILTTGAPNGRSTSTTTGAAAQAAGWLGGMVGAGSGKDTVLHSGEGTINAIKWSLTGRYVAWLNEHGIKIMRTKLHLESADAEDAWKRIGHEDRPQTEEWEEMASVWKGRVEWIDEQSIEPDEPAKETLEGAKSLAAEKLKQQQLKTTKTVERLLVGWGGTIWIMHIHPGEIGVGKNAGERSAGRADIAKKYANPPHALAGVLLTIAQTATGLSYFWHLVIYPKPVARAGVLFARQGRRGGGEALSPRPQTQLFDRIYRKRAIWGAPPPPKQLTTGAATH